MWSPSRVTSFELTTTPAVPAGGLIVAPTIVRGFDTVAPAEYAQRVKPSVPPDGAASIFACRVDPQEAGAGVGGGVAAGLGVGVGADVGAHETARTGVPTMRNAGVCALAILRRLRTTAASMRSTRKPE
jgi:hypothetical protein